jgi:hypothetical protein
MEVQRTERALAACGTSAKLPLEGIFWQHMIAKGRNRDTASYVSSTASGRIARRLSSDGCRRKISAGGETDQEVSRTGLAGEGEQRGCVRDIHHCRWEKQQAKSLGLGRGDTCPHSDWNEPNER